MPKSLEVDRFIMDSRPFNCLETPCARWLGTLCSAAAVANISLKDDEVLLASGEDIKDFFYSFKIGAERVVRNALNMTVLPEQVCHLVCFSDALSKERLLVPCLSTMAMGDSQAVSVGQTSHLGVVLQSGALTLSQILLQSAPVPRDKCIFGLILDDLIVLERVVRSKFLAGDLESCSSQAIMQKVREGYVKANLPRHPDKGFELQPRADFWGISFDGLSGIVRGGPWRVVPLAQLTSRIATLGLATVGLLQSVAGAWVSVMLLSRRCLSILDKIYAAQSGRGELDVIRLSPSLCEELLVCAILAPLMQADLRLPFDDRILATDASGWGEAGVYLKANAGFVGELVRHSCAKGAWTRLLPPSAAWLRERHLLDADSELPGEQEAYRACPLFTHLARSSQFVFDFASPRTKNRHINEGELKSVIVAEARRAYAKPWHKLLCLCDSQVVCGSITKGRSSSENLRKLLLQSLGVYLALGPVTSLAYLASEDNPADDPTRGKEIRQPVEKAPSWLQAAWQEDFGPLDAALEGWGFSPHDVSKLPDPSELLVGSVPAAADHPCESEQLSPGAGSVLGRPSHINPSARNQLRHSEVKAQVPFDSFIQIMCPAESASQLCEIPASQFVLASSFRGNLAEALQFKGALDLYSGKRGVAKQLVKQGVPWVLCYDWEHDPSENLLESSVQDTILALVGTGCFVAIGLAPLCTSFSTAVTPPIRSRVYVEGVPWATANQELSLRHGNQHCRFCVLVIKLGLKKSCVVWLENPDNSWFWRQPCVEKLLRRSDLGFWRFDACRFSAPWRKRTKVLTNSDLAGVKDFCRGEHAHVILQGRCSSAKANWTKLAQVYPKGVCVRLASGIVEKVYASTACSGSEAAQIGEATKPGPRRRKSVRETPLEAVSLFEPATDLLRSKLTAQFKAWLCAEVGAEVAEDIFKCPVLLVEVLQPYGYRLYRDGSSLYYFRQLLAHLQRCVVGLKACLSPAWEIVTRWELVEPVQHRPPLPEALLQAMAGLAIALGWVRFSLVLQLAFYCATRPGEVLKATRGDVLTPVDLLDDAGGACLFLKLRTPKTRKRGARIQHAKLTLEPVISYVSKELQNIRPDSLIFPGSPSSFRRRWDYILSQLGVSPRLRVTPGSLRGGGAVWAYRSGKPLTEILWLMRLKNLETLQYYLQEVAADSILASLPVESIENVKACRALYRSVLGMQR